MNRKEQALHVLLMMACAAFCLLVGKQVHAQPEPEMGCSDDNTKGFYYSSSRYTNCFSGEADTELYIKDRIIERINDYSNDSSIIRIAMFDWSDSTHPTEVACELAEAAGAGATVLVAYDDMDQGILDVFDGDPYFDCESSNVDTVSLTNCNLKSCLPGEDDGGAHNKFFLFWDTDDDDTKLLLQTSANMTGKQLTTKYNNLVEIAEAGTLFDAYYSYFSRMMDKGWGSWDTNSERSHETSSYGRVHFFPRLKKEKDVTPVRPKANTDPVYDDLKLILDEGCEDVKGDAEVWIAMSRMSVSATNARPWLLTYDPDGTPAEQGILRELQDDGCDVKVLISDAVSQTNRENIEEILGSDNVHMVCGLHDKIIITNEPGEGTDGHRRVYVGSHFLTENSLYDNDEAMLRIGDANRSGGDYGLFQAYQNYFQELEDIQEAADADPSVVCD